MGLNANGLTPLNYLPGNDVAITQVPNSNQQFTYATTLLLTANLPTPAVAGVGGQGWVSDATSRVGGSALTGGGSIITPVWTDGITWYVGGGV